MVLRLLARLLLLALFVGLAQLLVEFHPAPGAVQALTEALENAVAISR